MDHGPKLGGCAPFGGELGPHPTQCCWGRAYLHAKFHLVPSNHLATVHQRHRQDRQTGQTDRQWSDSIGQTVLQTVAQQSKHWLTYLHANYYIEMVSLKYLPAHTKQMQDCSNYKVVVCQ